MYDRAVHLMGQPITVLGKLGDSVLFSGLSSPAGQLAGNAARGASRHALDCAGHLALTVALVWFATEGVTWLFLGAPSDESAPIVQVLFAAVAFRALTKLGDANMRATDGLTAGIAIKVAFFMAIVGRSVVELGSRTWHRGAVTAVVLVLQWLLLGGCQRTAMETAVPFGSGACEAGSWPSWWLPPWRCFPGCGGPNPPSWPGWRPSLCGSLT